MFSRLRAFYNNRSVMGKINIAVISAAGIIFILIMILVLFRTKNIVEDSAKKYA